MMKNRVASILHVSDLHLMKPASGAALLEVFRQREQAAKDVARFLKRRYALSEAFKAVVASRPAHAAQVKFLERWAREMGSKCDLIIISGDLAHTGAYSDLRLARDTVERIVSNVTNRLCDPIALIPGNHDRYSATVPLAPGGVVFDKVFTGSPTLWEGSQKSVSVKNMFLGGEPCVVVGLDLSLRKQEWRRLPPFGFPGRGHCYPDVLKEAVEVSKNATANGKRVIWVEHFAPEFRGLAWALGLGKSKLLLEAACEAKVGQIFCGHTHVTRWYRPKGGPDIICAGTPTASAGDGVLGGLLVTLQLDDGRYEIEECVRYGRSEEDMPGEFAVIDSLKCEAD